MFRFCLIPLWAAFVCSSAFSDVEVSLEPHDSRPLPRMLYTFNTQLATPAMYGTFTYGGKHYNETVKALKPAALRFPGGTVGNHYDWRNDAFYIPEADFTAWALKLLKQFNASGRPYGMKGYVRSAHRLGMEEVYVANIFSEDGDSIVKMIEKIRKLGGEAPYIELGNEAFWDPKCHNDVVAYEALARPVAEAIRAYDPSIKIGVCVGPIGKKGNYEEIWNAPIGRDTSWYDAIIHHEYIGGQGLPVDVSLPGTLSNAVYPEEEMEHSLAMIRQTNPDMPIWMTEYNLGKKLVDENWGSMGHMMGIAAMQVFLFNHPDEFEIASFHQLYGKRWSAVHYDGKRKELIRTPSFFAYQQIGDSINGMEELMQLDVSIAGGSEFPERDIEAVGFGKGGNLQSVLFLNKSSKSVVVKTPSGGIGEARSMSRASMSDTFPAEADASVYEYLNCSEKTVTVPGNSITWLKL